MPDEFSSFKMSTSKFNCPVNSHRCQAWVFMITRGSLFHGLLRGVIHCFILAKILQAFMPVARYGCPSTVMDKQDSSEAKISREARSQKPSQEKLWQTLWWTRFCFVAHWSHLHTTVIGLAKVQSANLSPKQDLTQ